ncbi:type I restriction/modification system, S subunit [Campylobacter lari RM16712]|uniref:type I restriction/modification system, S subunit n=1 Tax=Campylobacter lari TaxID=201 RepID=UPI00058219F1|nr:type I restriction/modification system, S subunit [Campylobacter lari]AJD07054.1 type I restriction/modification system, S subunit [Campylobacter lari RM16712]
MRMNKKKEIVPKFRFPKYVNSEQWISTELSSLLDYERPDLYIVESDNYKNEGIPVLTANKSFILGYTDEKNNIYSCVPVIIFDDFTTEKKYVDFPFKVKSSAIKILKPKGNNVLKFVFELMNTINFEAKEHKRYYISTYQKLFVCVPKDVKEQQKIADCLSSIDELINAESKKLKALKKYKKGLMQKLFPADGNTLPELRFPEFTDKWQNEKLGNIFTSRQDTGFAYLSLMSLTDESGLIPQKETNKKDNSNADKSKYLRVCKGDIVYNTMRMWQGRCAYCENEGIVSPAYTVCTPKDDCDGVFFYYYFKTYSLIQKFHANSQGLVSDTLNLRFDKFASIMINYPIKKEEQQKIADCLSSIDELINAESKKLKALEKYKKGLLQGLFSSFDEVNI